MRAELPVLSFIAVLSLLILVPFCLKSRNIPFFFLIAWLFLCNIIQGSNTIIWANNVSTHAQAWCDIVTPITLAVRVALPAITLCLCHQLETISSSLDISEDPRSKYFTPIFQFTICLFLPVVYTILHVIVQYQRFTIVENFGCEASIYISIPAILIIWPLPLFLCSITMFYAGLSFYNYHRRCAFFSQHLHPRSTLTKALFVRILFVSVFIVLTIAFVSIFDMTSRLDSGLKPWTSWDDVHSSAGGDGVGVVSIQDRSPDATRTLIRTEIVWWLIPISSILLAVVMGSAKEVFRSNLSFLRALRIKCCCTSTSDDDVILPIQQISAEFAHPVTYDPFKSSWEETVRSSQSLIAQPIRAKPKLQIQPIQIPVPITTPSPSPILGDCDASFMASTLTYLESPTGKEALGNAGFVLPTSVPDAHTKPLSPPFPISPVVTLPSLMPPPRPRRPKDDLTLSSPWPRPPNLYSRATFSPQPPQSTLPARNRSYTFGSPFHPTVAPMSPLQGLGVVPSPSVPLLAARNRSRSTVRPIVRAISGLNGGDEKVHDACSSV